MSKDKFCGESWWISYTLPHVASKSLVLKDGYDRVKNFSLSETTRIGILTHIDLKSVKES